MKTRLIFIRHAQAEGNILREFHGWTDSGITADGHKQAKLMAERLIDMKIEVLYSSSLKRTIQTAEYISKIKKLPIIRTDKLKEINGGDWEGVKFAELPEKFPESHDTWENRPHEHKMPNGESMVEFQARLLEEVKSITLQNLGKNICIVTHGTAIKAMMSYFKGSKLEDMLLIPWYDNTSISIIDVDDDKFDVVLEGDASHLDPSLSTIQNQDWWHDYQRKLEENKKKRGNEEMKESKLVSWLFETTAFRVCPPKKPFWYTSGTIGPYYINTHFLYGSEKKANELLAFIDAEKGDKAVLTNKLLKITRANYESDVIYKGLIDFMIDFIKEKVDVDKIDYISGGERRDWFFSIIVAELLNKPHITIFKDLDAYVGKVTDKEFKKASSISGAKVLHIADLITEASSYERAWVPAIKAIGGELTDSVVVIDRMQGGGLILEGLGVNSHAMISIDESLFDIALNQGLINEEQSDMLAAYFHNPKESMKNFLLENKTFLEEALKGDTKTAERAKLMLEKDIYGLD